LIGWTELTLFIYITARMSGFVLFNPLLGRNTIPALFKAGFILMMTVGVFSAGLPAVELPVGLADFMLRIILELLLGVLIGMIIHFFFYIPQLAGEVIDLQMGMTMNQVYDAGSQANMSVSGVLLNILMMLLFFASNAHLVLLKIMMTSGDVIPFGEAVITRQSLNAALELFVLCTVFAVKISMPILAASLIGQLGMGVLMKVIPQINVFAINIELKVIIGLVLLFLLISPFSEYLLQIEMNMLRGIEEVLQLTSA